MGGPAMIRLARETLIIGAAVAVWAYWLALVLA